MCDTLVYGFLITPIFPLPQVRLHGSHLIQDSLLYKLRIRSQDNHFGLCELIFLYLFDIFKDIVEDHVWHRLLVNGR